MMPCFLISLSGSLDSQSRDRPVLCGCQRVPCPRNRSKIIARWRKHLKILICVLECQKSSQNIYHGLFIREPGWIYILWQLVCSLSPDDFSCTICLPNQGSKVVWYSLEDLAAGQNCSWQLHWLYYSYLGRSVCDVCQGAEVLCKSPGGALFVWFYGSAQQTMFLSIKLAHALTAPLPPQLDCLPAGLGPSLKELAGLLNWHLSSPQAVREEAGMWL